jgi:protoheme IX farnesyltransferase
MLKIQEDTNHHHGWEKNVLLRLKKDRLAPSEKSGQPTPGRFKDYLTLTKFRLAALVIISAVLGYLIGAEGVPDAVSLIAVTLGGSFITASANGLNQVFERESDQLMDRTKDRPLAAGRMDASEGLAVSLVTGILGTLILWFGTNPTATLLSLGALLIYAFIYTPLKRHTPIAVFVGAIPGALPPLLGWVAATGKLGYEALVLFFVQFMWQFPHFWAIAWRMHDDYLKAGFWLLPLRSGHSKENAAIIFFYTAMLIPVVAVPYAFGFIKLPTLIAMEAVSVYFLYTSYRLFKTCSMEDAKRVMFASFFYLPVVQLLHYINF